VNKNTVYPTDHSSGLQDNVILEHYGLNELNYESVKSYRERFASVKPNHPWNGLETKEFLYKIGAWGKLRNSSKEGVTLAGLLMFSEERIITEVLPQYFLEYRESLSDIVNGTWSKRFTSQDGTWSGNVYDFYFKVMSHIVADSFAEQTIRPALHEALINAIVHCDYDGEGGIVVEKEHNLFRFSNPGLFRIPIEQAFEGGVSNLRNPNLFKMFILIGLCKRAGSGLKSIELTWKQQNWPKPELVQHIQSKRTILTLNVLAGVQQYEEHINDIDEELDFFVTDVSTEGNSINNPANSINNSVNSVNKEGNFLNKTTNSDNKTVNSINNSANYVNKPKNSVNNSANSVNKKMNSLNNDKSSPPMQQMEEKVDKTRNETVQDEMEEKLWRIAELARKKKRLSPAIMEEIILQLCSQRPLMLKELAYLLERTPDGLRNNYLAKLLNEGKIKLKYPDQPNHPRQAYMIAK
jgi:ATP-dependent DNA helicase RecG